MQNDKEAVLAAVQQEGMALKYISDELRNNKNFLQQGLEPLEDLKFKEHGYIIQKLFKEAIGNISVYNVNTPIVIERLQML